MICRLKYGVCSSNWERFRSSFMMIYHWTYSSDKLYTSVSVNESMLVCIFKLCLCFLFLFSLSYIVVVRRKKRLDSIAAAVPSTHGDDDKDEDGDGDNVHDVLLRHHERHHHHIVLEACRGTKKATWQRRNSPPLNAGVVSVTADMCPDLSLS